MDSFIEVHGPDANNSLSATLPKDTLKSLFHMIVGKTDSVTKSFPRAVSVGPDEIVDLNVRVGEKLQQHNVLGQVTQVTISYSKNVVKEFTWAEFAEHRWTGAENSKALVVRWDFMLSLPTSPVPQRHVLTVRISSDQNPMHILQLALNPDQNVEEADAALAPVFCRVDFINALLSNELLSIVDGWHSSLRDAAAESAIWKLLRRADQVIHLLTHQLFRASAAAIACMLLWRTLLPRVDPSPTTRSLAVVSTWIICSLVFMSVSETVGHLVARRVSRRLDRNSRGVVLQLTKGDRNRAAEATSENSNSTKFVITNLLLAVIGNMLTNLIVWIATQ